MSVNELSKSEQLLARSHRGASTVFTQKAILDMIYKHDQEDIANKRPVYEHLQAAVLTQICYWFSPDKDGTVRARYVDANGVRWLTKNPADWWREIRTTKSQVSYALDKLQEKKFIVKDYDWVAGQNRTTIRLNDEVFAPRYEEIVNQDIVNPYIKKDRLVQEDEKDDEKDLTDDGISPSLEGGSPQVCEGDLPKFGFPSNSESTIKDHSTDNTAEGSSLRSPPPLSSAKCTEGTGSDQDSSSTRSTKIKGGPNAQPPRVRKSDRKNGAAKKDVSKNDSTPELKILRELHDLMRHYDAEYADYGDDMDLRGTEPEYLKDWLGGRVLDLNDSEQRSELAHWFMTVYKPGMQHGFDRKMPSLQWLLNSTTRKRFLAARKQAGRPKAEEPEEPGPRIRAMGQMFVIDGREAELRGFEYDDDGVCWRILRYDDDLTEFRLTDEELDKHEKTDVVRSGFC